ncbi:(2Fe-2S) ferredoxin domain-containing protein [Phytopseudomonas daroniae]|uniref:(2Fe-2S) ferredoxin domain-containing protein n=1 Tax=Phytopseudomonas daroniae TaxID=2487519 RepID=UPI00103834F9|nr:(2Fe-2S) ferredoxin domain-containing protein [Pseudomonas daroniae]TBU75523.1 2Fe-2S ferredoxin [Pseudomonas daroniae]
MTTTPYAQVLFAGPDLLQGSFAELFRARLVELRGQGALAEIVDTAAGHDDLWLRVREGSGTLLVIDLEAQSSSQHVDWLRSELAGLVDPSRVFVTSLFGQLDADAAAAACALIERPELHLSCVDVPALPSSHAWSKIPAHQYRVLLCNGPRCTRRGALPLWKALRERVKAAGRLECDGGVHITRTQCQFPCDQGPTLSVYPPGAWYRIRSEADVARLVDEQLIHGRPVPELSIRDVTDSRR